jgi:hypothetical protein
MHRLPTSLAGIAARVAALIVTLAHQQCSTGRSSVMAHWLSAPHSGQIFSSDSVSNMGPSLFLDVAL